MFCVFSTASPIWAKDSIIKLFSVYIVNTGLYGIYSKSTSQCLSCGYYENVFKVEFHNSLFAKILIFSEITILSQKINSFI